MFAHPWYSIGSETLLSLLCVSIFRTCFQSLSQSFGMWLQKCMFPRHWLNEHVQEATEILRQEPGGPGFRCILVSLKSITISPYDPNMIAGVLPSLPSGYLTIALRNGWKWLI